MTGAASEQRSDRRPRVLLLYYTYTGQALKVLEAAGEVFRDRGCDVQKAEIEFTDRRFAGRFFSLPDATCVARHAQCASGPDAPCQRGDPHPGCGATTGTTT